MQGLLTGVLRIFSLVECGGFSRLESGFIGDGCRGLGVCLSPELLFAGLFGCAVAKLCAIFTPGRGEVAVFGSVEVAQEYRTATSSGVSTLGISSVRSLLRMSIMAGPVGYW